MTVLTTTRLMAILAEVRTLASTHHHNRAEHIIGSATKLGGIFSWGIEQGQFAGEMLKAETVRAYERRPPSSPPPVVPGFSVLLPLNTADSSLASYQTVGDDGEPLWVRVSMPGERRRLVIDAKLAESMFDIAPSRIRRVSAEDLTRLLADVVFIALMDGDLDEEASGLDLGADSAWFDSPRVVLRDRDVLVETEIAGIPIETLPGSQREAVYHAAVENWARALLEESTLVSSLRRDRLRVNGTRLGLSRWAGARQPSPDAAALLRSLVMASFANTSSAQGDARDRFRELIADGLGIEGSLDLIASPILSLLRPDGPVKPDRERVSRAVVRQSTRYRPERRVEILLLLRQLVWLRDVARACGVSDPSVPWHRLSIELG